MAVRHKYLKRSATLVVAVQLDLETAGFTYRNGAASRPTNRVTGL
jgi:hypothetical protein